MPRVRPLPTRAFAVLLGGVAAIGVVVIGLRALPEVSPTTIALALLLVVLATATFGRLWIATVTAITATVAFNFFFLPPLGTLTIADAQNWIALFAFLVVAVIGSNLSAAVQARAREAIARRNEVTRLFDLTRDVLLTTETTGAIEALARHVARRFELSQVAICLPVDQGWRKHQGGSEDVAIDDDALNIALAKARGVVEFDARQRAYGGHMRVGPEEDVSIVPLRHGTKAVGLLAASSSTLDIGALDAVAGVVAIAIERAQFLAERDAAELVKQKADLAATLLASLSHDLRTPLTAIRVAVENLRGDLSPDDRREQARAATSELGRLTLLFQDILDMARIDAAAIRIDRDWVTAEDVVDAAIAHVRHLLEERSIRVEAPSDLEVEIDPRLASGALSHILENAAQYSPSDREIVVEARVEHDGLHVSVTDHGPGLDSGELEHLFERFYRGHTARQTTFGTGMGLSITRGLLAAAGGRVWAENVPAGGARFSIVVPGGVRPAPVPQ
ncbi:MAG TPA: ATP-binding protein [Vicinamibacterales bacterium]|nr:ATP-binding protein [Vicinamibacterales bacterium]